MDDVAWQWLRDLKGPAKVVAWKLVRAIEFEAIVKKHNMGETDRSTCKRSRYCSLGIAGAVVAAPIAKLKGQIAYYRQDWKHKYINMYGPTGRPPSTLVGRHVELDERRLKIAHGGKLQTCA